MAHLAHLREFSLINKLTRPLARHPDQVNRTHESDAELVRQPDGSILAVTVDTLEEEYRLGLIRDPHVVGWATVTHSLSDLAAVAATPIGAVLALNLPRDLEGDWSERFFAGAADALTAHGTWCLGGDTNFTTQASFSCTAIGRITTTPPLQRVGAKAGDALYITGSLGAGNLLAIARQVDAGLWAEFERGYRPRARLAEAAALRPFMRCAIDTSDALLQGMAILAGLNDVGMHFEHDPAHYDPRLVGLAEKIRFPLWLANVFGLGEHELLFTVDPAQEQALQAQAKAGGHVIRRIGEVRRQAGITMTLDGRVRELDATWLLNLFGECPSVEAYIKKLGEYDARLRQS